MTMLTPTAGWDDVPQLETTTLALGGPGGPMNSQAQALLNRLMLLSNSRVIDSIAALKALDHTKHTRAFVSGYYAAGDNGGGEYYYDATDTTSADNGGTIIVATDGARWKLIHTGTVTVRQFGAKGDGTTDDKPSFVAAAATGLNVWVPDGVFALSGGFTLGTVGQSFDGVGTIKPLATFAGSYINAVCYVTAAGCAVRNLRWDLANTTTSNSINFIIWGTSATALQVHGNRFYNMPSGVQPESCVGANQPSDGVQVWGNYFENVPGAVFLQGPKCLVAFNGIKNPNDVAIALNSTSSIGCVIKGNVINNLARNVLSGAIGMEEGASEWVVEGNFIYGLNGGYGISATNISVFSVVNGGTIRNNTIDGGGGTTTNPCTGINHSQYYLNVQVTDNFISNLPTGSAGTRYMVLSMTGGKVARNRMDATNTTDLAGAVTINPNGYDLSYEHNESIIVANRHVIFGSADGSSKKCVFIGGKMLGGAEGINTALSNPTNLSVWLIDMTECTATNPVNMGTNQNWGSRQSFINSYRALTLPHSIKGQTEMRGNAIPTSGNWSQGDTVWNVNPAASGIPGWMCTVAGAPGTWKSMGALSA